MRMAPRIMVLALAAAALLATSPARTEVHDAAFLDVVVPAGEVRAYLATVAVTDAAATQERPAEPWSLDAELDASPPAPQPVTTLLPGPDVDADEGKLPEPCPPAEPCVRHYRVEVAAPAGRDLDAMLWLSTAIRYDQPHRDRDGEVVGFTTNRVPTGANLVLVVEGHGRGESPDGEQEASVFLTRDRPAARAVVRRAIPAADLPPGARTGDVAHAPVVLGTYGVIADEDTSAIASWRDPSGAHIAKTPVDRLPPISGSAELACEGQQCTIELVLSVRLEAGEWARLHIEHIGLAEPGATPPRRAPDSMEVRYD